MGEAVRNRDFADCANDAAIREAVSHAKPVAIHAPLPLRRALQAGQPYPVGAMGATIGAAVKAASESVQAPLELCAQSALANAALAVPGHANALMPWGEGKP